MIEDYLPLLFSSQWVLLVLVSVTLILLAEAGYRFGLSARRRNPEAAESQSGSVQGAVLGLLGLLLGFTFAMAVGRYDNRRELAVAEANSIGTTWLRTGFLGEPRSTEARAFLRRYTEIRLEANEHAGDKTMFAKLVEESTNLQDALWTMASQAAKEQPDAVRVSFVTTLNETIDLQSTRLAAMRNHVPGAVWLLLLVVAGCGSWASGYASGTGGQRSTFNQIIFPMLIGVVVTLISDIDHPRQGLIGVSQEPLRELLESMK